MMEKVTIDVPTAAAGSGGVTSDKNRLGAALPEKPGKPSVLLFVRGAFCQHCMTQLTEMATKLSSRRPRGFGDQRVRPMRTCANFPPVPFTLVADPKLRIFRKYGVPDGDTKHATIALDASGKEIFRDVADEPLVDASGLLECSSRCWEVPGRC